MSIALPTSRAQPVMAPSVETPRFSAKNDDSILIVDDSAVVRKSFVKGLSASYNCVEAESVQEAFTLLREHNFALVIADIIMPGLSGIELLRKVIESHPDTAVIMVSGIDRPQRALDAVRLGAFDYLIKPCDMDVLEMTVERALERRNLLLQASRYKQDLEARNVELVRGKAQLQRLQAQIVQSEKMASIGQLAAGIAHELNNPVSFVTGNLDFLNQRISGFIKLLKYYDKAELSNAVAAEVARVKEEIDYATSLDDLASIIHDCREGADRICSIVQNLRTFSRLDEAEFKKTDIHEGIDASIRLLSRYFTSDNIRLIRNYGELPPIDSYSGQLNQVWMNLLANAAQAVGTRTGEVSITTRTGDDTIIVEIGDTGGGIAAEHVSRIFDPFFTTKPVGEGTGLGLSISFGIVERHGGQIELTDSNSRGSTFTVTLPKNVNPQVSAIAEYENSLYADLLRG